MPATNNISPEFKFCIAFDIAFSLFAISYNLLLLIDFFIDNLIFFGFSNLGLSSVKYILSQNLFAILPIFDLLDLSLSPPQPKTITIFLFLYCCSKFCKQLLSASGV